MIVVTGATGNIGKTLVRSLIEAGEKVTAVSRSVTAADVPEGVAHRRADLARPAELTPALDGAEALFLLTSGEFVASVTDLGEVLEVVRRAGVRRVVMLSSQGVGTGRHPTAFEDIVTGGGLDWTILRPGGFASNATQWATSIRTDRTVAAPFADVALPVIDPDDIAEVAALTLRADGHHGRTYVLTGPAPISPRRQAEVLGDVLGEPVRFVELSRAEAAARMGEFMPAPIVAATLDILGSPVPAEQRVSPDVEGLLGRPARTFADWAARHATSFR
ncbi:NAD(P)H-binding protein [Nocardia takedensis]